MTTNITLKIDESLLHNVYNYAKRKGMSISELFESQLRALLQNQTEVNTKPVSTRLRGIIQLPTDFDYKKELENRVI